MDLIITYNTTNIQHDNEYTLSIRQASPYWREAATLILASSQKTGKTGVSNVINTAGTSDAFEVLMLKRDSASSFMPNAFVYPGGMRSPADFDRKRWQSIFKRNANMPIGSVENVLQIPRVRSPMLLPNGDSGAHELSADLGFRICALRETFEESGILLVSHKDDLAMHDVQNRSLQPPMYTLPEKFDVKSWRQRVSSNAYDFGKLCEEYDVVPNIWALYEWSNWLTPVMCKVTKPPVKPMRFDTMFYMCCLDSPVEGAEACTEETSEVHWKSPHEWRRGHLNRTAIMMGPQVYETSRLTSFMSKSVLFSYMQQREPLGMIRYLPIIIQCNDGVFMVLPGDELYPTNPDVNGTEGVLAIAKDFTNFMTKKVNSRFHRHNLDDRKHLITITPPCGLLAPHDGDAEDPLTVIRNAMSKL